MTPLKKPVRRRARVEVAHNINPEICVTLYPGGVLGIRELGRRQASEVRLALGELYERAKVEEAYAARRARRRRG